MKILNFSVVEKLHSLLDKSCSQTIRPAWVDSEKGERCTEDAKEKSSLGSIPSPPIKPPRFEVGDKCQILWNQRSKYKTFCSKCGKGQTYKMKCGTEVCCKDFIEQIPTSTAMPITNDFNKLLGTVEITEVFKIEMGYVTSYGKPTKIFWIKEQDIDNKFREVLVVEEERLAKRDGFSSAEQMFSCLDKMYDLSQPKTFYVYRWVWK